MLDETVVLGQVASDSSLTLYHYSTAARLTQSVSTKVGDEDSPALSLDWCTHSSSSSDGGDSSGGNSSSGARLVVSQSNGKLSLWSVGSGGLQEEVRV